MPASPGQIDRQARRRRHRGDQRDAGQPRLLHDLERRAAADEQQRSRERQAARPRASGRRACRRRCAGRRPRRWRPAVPSSVEQPGRVQAAGLRERRLSGPQRRRQAVDDRGRHGPVPRKRRRVDRRATPGCGGRTGRTTSASSPAGARPSASATASARPRSKTTLTTLGRLVDVDARDVGAASDQPFAEQEPQRQLAIGARRPHDHGKRLAVDAAPRAAPRRRRDRSTRPARRDGRRRRRASRASAASALRIMCGWPYDTASAWPCFGLGAQKPRHYREMVEGRLGEPRPAAVCLAHPERGVCDGCALGTSGLSDWTLPGTHLCMVRLELMRLNTAPALDPGVLADVAALARRSSARAARARPPARADAAARAASAASASSAGTRRWTASPREAARRRSAADRLLPDLARHHQRGLLRGAEGGAVPRHQPRRQLRAALSRRVDRRDEGDARPRRVHLQLRRLAGRRPDRACSARTSPTTSRSRPSTCTTPSSDGAQIAVVNPYPRAGARALLDPVDRRAARSFGTALADHWFDVHTGGDLAFLVGVLLALVERGGVDDAFVDAQHDRLRARRCAQAAGGRLGPHRAARAACRASASTRSRDLLIARPNAVFVWSMGLTQHAHGVDTVKALVNVGLARGLPGRPNRGLVPIRGHSGVQGGAEVGCVPRRRRRRRAAAGAGAGASRCRPRAGGRRPR